MTIMSTALTKAQALPSTIDERLAKIRKASLTTQKKSRGSSCCLTFSFWASRVIYRFGRAQGGNGAYPRRLRRCGPAPPACDRAGLLPTENQTEHETDPERGKHRFCRILADVLFAVVLKSADAMKCIVQHFFPALPIFIGHCACGRAEIFRRLARMRHATICFFLGLGRNRRPLAHLIFVI